MSRKRILITTPNFITAGSGLVILELLRRLDRSVFEPVVCVLRRGGLDTKVEELGIRLICEPFAIPAKPRLSLLPRAWQAARRFKALRIDVWHSWHYLDDYTEPIIARLARVKQWVYTKNNLSWGNNAWRVRSILASHIIADNPQMLHRFFSSELLNHKVSLIPHGVDVRNFKPCSNTQANLRSALTIPDGSILVGCVANLIPIKDHPTLIRAVATAASQPHLVLAGRGDESYVDSLKALVHDLGISNRVHFQGYIPNDKLPELLSELDMFVLTSRYEALPVALMEAMACETACIATNSGGSDAVISDGEDGFIVSVGDVEALAVKIDECALDQPMRRRIGKAARRKVVERFNADREAEAYARLYSDLSAKAR